MAAATAMSAAYHNIFIRGVGLHRAVAAVTGGFLLGNHSTWKIIALIMKIRRRPMVVGWKKCAAMSQLLSRVNIVCTLEKIFEFVTVVRRSLQPPCRRCGRSAGLGFFPLQTGIIS